MVTLALFHYVWLQKRPSSYDCLFQVTSKGPAMTWSMFSIGNLEIGDITKASTQFTRQLLNVAKPFNVTKLLWLISSVFVEYQFRGFRRWVDPRIEMFSLCFDKCCCNILYWSNHWPKFYVLVSLKLSFIKSSPSIFLVTHCRQQNKNLTYNLYKIIQGIPKHPNKHKDVR